MLRCPISSRCTASEIWMRKGFQKTASSTQCEGIGQGAKSQGGHVPRGLRKSVMEGQKFLRVPGFIALDATRYVLIITTKATNMIKKA